MSHPNTPVQNLELIEKLDRDQANASETKLQS